MSSSFIESTKAQVIFAYFPGTPDTQQPSIIINSPIANATYNSTEVTLSFTIIKPYNWTYTYTGYENVEGQSEPLYIIFGRIISVYYAVDNGANNSITVNDACVGSTTTCPQNIFNFNINLNLTGGQHSLLVGVEAVTYYVTESIPPSSVSVNAISNAVNFTVLTPFKQVQPVVPSKQKLSTNAFPTQTIIELAVVIVIICSVGMLFYVRHRKTAHPNPLCERLRVNRIAP
jgi:hypothetical protein